MPIREWQNACMLNVEAITYPPSTMRHYTDTEKLEKHDHFPFGGVTYSRHTRDMSTVFCVFCLPK